MCDETASAGSLRFSKISQAAIVSGTTWVTDELIANNFTSSTTIPKGLKAGDYVVRHEIIALHGAGSDNGAQVSYLNIPLKIFRRESFYLERSNIMATVYF